jgi:hypothetical protein
MASSADMKAELGSRENPITEDDAPPTAAEEGDADEVVPAVESDPNEKIAGAVIGGVVEMAKFHIQNLINLMKALLSVPRKIGIGIKNKTPHQFQSSGIYYYSGTSEAVIPYEVPSNYVCEWGARKSQSTARGAIGTYSYYMKDVNKTLHVMYHVPFDYNLYKNWWNATVVNGRQVPDKALHNNLYYGKGGMPYPHKAGNWQKNTINGFTLLGNMTTNGEATLELDITNA